MLTTGSALVSFLVVGVAAGCLGYVVLSYTSAFLFRPRSGSARLWRAALVELLVCWLLVPLWPLWWLLGAVYQRVEEGEGVALGRRHPVVLLHGFGMNRTQWIWMARRLRAHGHGPIYGLNYFSLQTVRASAEQLARQIDRVLEHERVEKVDLIAHSLGGIVARYYIERMSGGPKVGRLVTIGTPHGGTAIGRYGIGIPAARDLRGGSVVLTDLGPVRAGAVYTSIWSRADAIVQPPESSSIAPAGVDEVFDDLGHLSLVLSPRVVDLIDARLRA
jgi:pimeloyl-ACP methyl ester carboxylesterase